MASTSLSGASSDIELVTQWLRGRPDSTRRVYEPVAIEFIERVGALREATVERVTSYVEGLVGEPATRARLVSTIKSLLSWAWRTGYTSVNVGRALRCVRVPSKLHKKLLEEHEVKALVGASPPGSRDHALLVLLYVSGIRISEACGLSWGDLRGCHVSVLGKGTRSRTVLIPASVGDLLRTLSGSSKVDPGGPIFRSATTGGRLGVRAAREAVYRAAELVGKETLSPHWLRHAHATHALDRGCPIHVVQQSLGHATVATTSKYLHVRPTVGASQWLASPV